MKDGPDISRVAALIGDPARANMLLSLLDHRALTATELATIAGITRQTASSHLAQLQAGQLVTREVQGRHHYFALAGPAVGKAIEALMGLAERGPGRRLRTGPKDPALRKARICYDHLAGELGVLLLERFLDLQWIERDADDLKLTEAGHTGLAEAGFPLDVRARTRRPDCRLCLDWSVRRHHLAGRLGAVLLDGFIARGWTRRVPETRIMAFSQTGEAAFRQFLRIS